MGIKFSSRKSVKNVDLTPVGCDGAFGDYLGHGGRIGGSGGHVRTGIMKFNLQVEASLVANSPIGSDELNATTVLQQAYDAAWA